MKPIGKWVAAIALAAGAAWYAGLHGGRERLDAPESADGAASAQSMAAPAEAPSAQQGVDEAAAAFESRAKGRMLRVSGRVERLLADDREGSPHQRFVIATGRGQTLLVAHNLDLADRLAGLAVGDQVTVYGEYEWNPQGGVMHWTHDDPQGTHPAGYIDWDGRRYQ